MKRHLTATKSSHRGRGERGTGQAGESQQHLGLPSRPAEAEGEPAAVTLRSVRLRTHTLRLTGELHLRSAPILEEELERLYADGVTSVTLDLRELSYIDPIGVALVAFRCGLAGRRGYGLTVIAGSRHVHRALEQAGVTDLAPFDGEDTSVASETRATPFASGSPSTVRGSRKTRRRRLPRALPTAPRAARSRGLGGL